jgi:hypothetical protein
VAQRVIHLSIGRESESESVLDKRLRSRSRNSSESRDVEFAPAGVLPLRCKANPGAPAVVRAEHQECFLSNVSRSAGCIPLRTKVVAKSMPTGTPRTCDALRCNGKTKHTNDDEDNVGFAGVIDENDDAGRSRQRGR